MKYSEIVGYKKGAGWDNIRHKNITGAERQKMSNYYKNKYPIFIYIGIYNLLKKIVLFIWKKIKKK